MATASFGGGRASETIPLPPLLVTGENKSFSSNESCVPLRRRSERRTHGPVAHPPPPSSSLPLCPSDHFSYPLPRAPRVLPASARARPPPPPASRKTRSGAQAAPGRACAGAGPARPPVGSSSSEPRAAADAAPPRRPPASWLLPGSGATGCVSARWGAPGRRGDPASCGRAVGAARRPRAPVSLRPPEGLSSARTCPGHLSQPWPLPGAPSHLPGPGPHLPPLGRARAPSGSPAGRAPRRPPRAPFASSASRDWKRPSPLGGGRTVPLGRDARGTNLCCELGASRDERRQRGARLPRRLRASLATRMPRAPGPPRARRGARRCRVSCGDRD